MNWNMPQTARADSIGRQGHQKCYCTYRVAKTRDTDSTECWDAGEGLEQQEGSFPDSHIGRQLGGFFPNSAYSFHMTQPSQSLVFTQMC